MKNGDNNNSIFTTTKLRFPSFLIAIFVFLVFGGFSAFAQSPDWNSFLSISTFPSPYFSQWERDPSIGNLTLNYSGTPAAEFYFSVEITNPNYGTVVSGTTDSFNFEFGPTMRVFTFQDVVDWGSVSVNSQVDRLIKQTGMFPEGEYEVCIQTLAPSGNMLSESCASFEIIQPDPPQLISPVDEEIVETLQPTFLWNQVIVPPSMTDIYLLTIVEVLEGQTRYRAMGANQPVLEEKLVRLNTYTYSLDAYPLEKNKTYAWQVTAVNDEGTPIAKNNGKSEVWQFSLGSGGGDLNIDELTLVEDVAYLVDMQNLSVTDDGATITLEGSANMRLKFSDRSEAIVPVSVNGLSLQKDSYDNPKFFGGGVIAENIRKDLFPKSIVGNFFAASSIEFDIKGFLKIKGDFAYNGGSTVPLSGELIWDSFGLYGNLNAFADNGEAFFTLGDETVGVGITGIEIYFPSTQMNLTANAFLFNRISDCEIKSLLVDKNGELTADLNCDISTQFPLIPGSNLFMLGIDNINGKFTGNLLSAGKEDYNIDIKGKMTFNFNPENLFGAEVEFNLLPNQLNLTNFSPFGNYETSNIDLGWVNFLIEDLRLKNLSYANGAWDFEMTMGANFFFPDLFETPLPRLKNVSFTPQGFSFPKMTLSGEGIPPVDFEGFELTINQVRSEAFVFDLASWTPGSIADMNFEFDVLFNMPNLREGSDNAFSKLNFDLTAEFNSGNFSLSIPEFTFANPGAKFPLGGGLNFNVLKLSGELKTEYDGAVMNFLPDVKIKGEMDFPEAFACDDGNSSPVAINAAINVSGGGTVTGTARNIVPQCPLDLGFVTLTVGESALEFKDESGQKIYLDGTALLDFTSPDGNPISAKLHLRYELIEGKLIVLEGTIDEPFILTLLPDYPALRFEINGAEVENNLLKIDGRHKLLFDEGASLGATFDKFALSFEDLSIRSGGVIFDSPFAFMITGLEEFDLKYKAVPIGTPLPKNVSAIYLELPDKFGIDNRGLFAMGDAKAKMAYQGNEFEDLDITFTNDFAMYFSSPLHVVQGQCDIYYDKTKIAYINSDGFFPDPSFFINEAIPARLPLPTEDIAYLQIKDEATNEFIINIRETGTTIEYSTFEGRPVPLVFPSLRQGKPAPPQLPTEFNLTINKTTGLINSGFVRVTVPENLRQDFDLSDRGIPFEIRSIFYGDIGGVYAFRFTGVPKLFGEDAVCSDSASLTLYGDGRLEGNLNCDLNLEIPIIEGSDKLTLFVNNFNGDVLTNLLTPQIDFDFEIDANLKLKLTEEHDYNPWILLGFTPDGVEIRDYDLDTLGVGIIPISSSLELGISNLSVPALDWNSSNSGSGWNFEFGMDVLIRFPEFNNLTIPNLNGITLDNDGFHFPNISLPDLASLGGDGESLRFEFEGIGLNPLAFRMSAFDFDWFNSDGGEGDWDFGFDFELDFPNLGDDASDGMRFPEITMLDAHFNGGLILGEIEFTEFASPGLRFGLGGDFGLNFYTRGISGRFFNDGGSQGINFNINGNLQLPTFMQCDDGNDIVDLTETTFSFDSGGMISGRVERFAPECPIDLGFGIFRVTSSSLDFSIQENAQSAIMNMTGELEIPAGDDLTVTALGSLTMDLITGEIIDGEIRIDQEFVWSIPFENPVLSFRIQSAVLNGEGFAINGQSQLLLDGGSQIPVRFENFLFDLKNQRVKSGRLVIDESFAFKMKLETGGITWSAIPYDEPLTEADGNAAKIGMATTMILDSGGMTIDGEAIAAIRWLEDNYNALRVVYNGGFALGINPFAVVNGQADIYLDEENREPVKLAFLDSDGFHLGDMFELLEIPEKIPLPELDIAYLQIRQGENVFVETEMDGTSMIIRTKADKRALMVIPSLQYSNGAPPSFEVEFEAVLNPTTYEFISSSVTLLPREGETSVINLTDFGIPVELTRISYAQTSEGGAYKLTADGRFYLPQILSDMPLNLEDLEFDSDGIKGSFNMGRFSRLYVNVPSIAVTPLGETSAITLEGLIGDFEGSNFGFSGKFIPKLFNADGDTSKVHYAAEWNRGSRSFEFSFAFPSGEKWNLGIAEFEPLEIDGNPPISLSLSENDFEFILNGILTSDLFGDEFELPLENLTLSKRNVSAEPVSRNRANAFDFELFNSRFKIYDTGGDKALGIEYENDVLRLILSGDVEFFGLDAVVFNRFIIGTDGEFSVDGIDFLSVDDDELPIVDDMIVLRRIYLDANKLNFNGWVKLPEPADKNENNFDFAIFPDGRIDGSAEIVFLDQRRELGNGDESEYDFWEATLDPTYLSLFLNFGDIERSSVRMVGDIYFNNQFNKRMEIGDNSGNTVVPGFELFFNGNYQWKNIRSVGELPIIDWETFKVNLTNLSIPDGSNVFLLTLSGNFELNLEAAGGGLTFEDFRILSDGTVDRFAESINGGEFYILDVVTISVNNIGYNATPTTIEIESGTMPSGGSGATSYNVESYLQFGGSIDISGIASGEVEKFLTFKFNNRNQFIVKRAELSLPGIELMADFQYLKENNNSYNLLFGGSGEFAGQQIIVVGQVGKLRGKSSFGMFVAVPTVIPIGPIVITGLGGGFFYNPKQEYINIVKTLAGLDPRYTSRISNPGSSFAVFLYGKFVLVEEHIISARVLLTLTDSRFELDGKVTLLNKPDTFAAYLHLGIGFTDFFAEGNLVVEIDADPLLVGGTTGEGLGFYVYGSDTWGIYGNVDATILKILHVGSEFYLGSEGFLLKMETDFSFDIWIIEIGAGMEVKLWYIPNDSWGAYTKVYVYAEVLFGVAKARGWLLGALVGAPNFYIYASAGLEISVIGFSWDGKVWAKISGNGVDGGFGSNSELDKLINDAAETSGQIENAKNNMLDRIEAGQMIPVRITDEEMEAAFQTLYSWGRVFRYGTEADRQRANAFFNTIKSIELIPGYEPLDTQYDQEIMTYDWVINEVYKATHAPAINRRDDLHNYRAAANQRRTDFNTFRDELRPKLSESLEEIRSFIGQDIQTSQNPLLQTSFASPVANERIENGKTVKVVISKPGFEIDLSVNDMNKDAIAATEEAFNEYQIETGQALQKINNNIVKLETLLGGSEDNAGVRSVGEKYKTTLGYNELFFKQRQWYYSDEYTWANNLSVDWILGTHMKAPGFQSKTWNIFDNLGWEIDRDLCINRKIKILEISNATQGRIDDARARETGRWNMEAGNYDDPDNSNYFRSWVASEGISTGLALWSNLPIEYGLMEITSNARNVLAQNETEALNEKESMYHRQAIFTQTSDSLYDALSILYENQYDLITEYIAILQRRDNLSQGELFFKGLLILWKGQIEDKFRIPTITELKVINSDYGTRGYNKSHFQWQTSGAQVKNFAFDIRTQNPDFERQGYQNIGMNRSIINYFLKSPSANGEFGNVTFYLRARNGAGYAIKRSMTYQPAFKGVGDARNISDPDDNSPPSMYPILTFPNLFVKSFGMYYTTNTNSITAEWEAYDYQSGIQEYKYAIGTSSEDKTSVLDWTSNGGRDNVVVHGLNLEQGRAYQMFVKAKNGSGVWSDERIAAGILQRIIIDTTPPTKPGRIFALPPGFGGGHVFNPPGGWRHFGDPIEVIGPVSLPGQLRGKTNYRQPFLRKGGAEVAVNWLASNDPESGILKYEYKITNRENPSITSKWYDAGKNLNVRFHDNIMNYLDSFYVDIRSLNYANNTSESLRYLVRPVDGSIPTKPGIAMATSRDGRGVYLVINSFSVDRQSGVDHYIVTMGVAPGGDDLISSADAITFDLSDVNRSNCVYLGNNLPQARSSYFTIRAVNGQGMKSSKCITGPFEQDLTPPIKPRVTPSLKIYFGGLGLNLRYSRVRDPESGISQIQYAIYVVGRKPSDLRWNNAGVVTNTFLLIDDSFPLKLNRRGGTEIIIGVRTFNGFGLQSKEAWTLFNIPSR